MNYGATVRYTAGGQEVLFSKDSDFWLTATPDFSAVEVALSEVQSPKQVGVTLAAQNVQAKSITFTGTIVRSVEANRAKLLQVVKPGVTGRLTYSWGGKSYYLDCVPVRTPQIGSGIVTQDFQFVCRAAYPYWRSTTTLVVNINNGSGSSVDTVVNNQGNVPAEFELEIVALAAATSAKVTLPAQGKFIYIVKSLVAGERFVVSTHSGSRGVRHTPSGGSAANGFKYLSLDSTLDLALAPGNNTVRFAADAGRANLSATIRCAQGVYSGV